MKAAICIIVFFFSAVTTFAQDSDEKDTLSINLEELIEQKQTDQLDSMLLELTSPEMKSFAEEFIIMKAKEYVLSGDFDYALKLAEIVLLFNLDNTEAQNLYASIEVAKREKEEQEEKQRLEELEKQRQKEEEEQKAAEEEAEAKRIEEEKQQEESFEKSVNEISLDNFSLSATVSPASILIYGSEFADRLSGETTVHSAYGFQINGSINFWHPYIAVNLNFQYANHLLQLTASDLVTGGNAVFCLTTPLIGFPVVLRIGFSGMQFTTDAGEIGNTVLFQGFNTIITGIGIENLDLSEKISFSIGIDYLTMSIIEENIDFGINLCTSASFSIFDIRQNIAFTLVPSVQGTLLVSDAGSEWSIYPSISTGVKINDK
jgi:hypothetical protein